jgi:hypothetical protein
MEKINNNNIIIIIPLLSNCAISCICTSYNIHSIIYLATGLFFF